MEHYETATLVGVQRVQQVLDPYWLNLCFPKEITFETEEILFDQVTETRRLAPFVAPTHQGRLQKRRGYAAKSFRPAYVKPKDEVRPSQMLARTAGESLATGSLSLEARRNARVAELLRLQKEEIIRRCDWMGARAVIDGSVTVSGDDYPTVVVDFGRAAELTMTLAGTATWDGVDADPLANIETIRTLVQKNARAAVNRLTFGLDAWAEFIKDPKVLDLLDANKRGSTSDFNSNLGQGLPYEFRGVLQGKGTGSLELYTYSDTYEDEDGNDADYLDPKWVVATGPGIQGVRCYGAILDDDALRAMSIFPKSWKNDDPSVRYVMSQSAPLMVPAQPNGSAVIKALA